MTRKELEFFKTLRPILPSEIDKVGLFFFFIRHDVITDMCIRARLTEQELAKYGIKSSYYHKVNVESIQEYQEYLRFLVVHAEFIFVKK